MASQNVDPSRINHNTRKQKDKSSVSSVGLHSVTQRLQQDLMTLMVRRRAELTPAMRHKNMTNTTVKALQIKDTSIVTSGEKHVSAFPEGDNLFFWKATITGAEGTAYEGLDYKLSIEFPDRYPFVAPKMKFITPCYHPNVDHLGNICLDILKDKWSALMDVRTVLLSIQLLLSVPNNKDPLNSEAAQMWENRTEYAVIVQKKYREHAAKTE